MTVTNESLHCSHMKLFIHKNYLHEDMKSSAAQASSISRWSNATLKWWNASVTCFALAPIHLSKIVLLGAHLCSHCSPWESNVLFQPFAHELIWTHEAWPTGFHRLQSLTCLQGGGGLLTDVRSAAHRGTGAQVELVFTQRLQVTQAPLGGIRIADVYCLQRSHFVCVID